MLSETTHQIQISSLSRRLVGAVRSCELKERGRVHIVLDGLFSSKDILLLIKAMSSLTRRKELNYGCFSTAPNGRGGQTTIIEMNEGRRSLRFAQTLSHALIHLARGSKSRLARRLDAHSMGAR